MTVEILILTGHRQGERLSLDKNAFHAGDGADCEIRFDPKRDAGAHGSLISFSAAEQNWIAQNAGGKSFWINQTPVATQSVVRSGEVVRLSERGPDFIFALTPCAGAIPPCPPVPSLLEEEIGGSSAGFPPSKTTGAGFTGTKFSRKYAQLLAVSVALVILLGMAHLSRPWWGKPFEPEKPTAEVSSPVTTAEGKLPFGTSETVTPKSSPSLLNNSAAPSPPVPVPVPVISSIPSNALLEKCREGIYLLKLEEPQGLHAWPFATACAIREGVLLTSARVATELAAFRKQGWKVKAFQPARQAEALVTDLLVMRQFLTASKPEEMYYHDFALLRFDGKASGILPLADAGETAILTEGIALTLLCIPHEGEKIDRFSLFAAQAVEGKIFLATTLPTDPRAKLLHLKITPTSNSHGGPVVNARGAVVAVYSQIEPAGAALELKVSFAPIIDQSRFAAEVDAAGDSTWVPPAVPADSNPTVPEKP